MCTSGLARRLVENSLPFFWAKMCCSFVSQTQQLRLETNSQQHSTAHVHSTRRYHAQNSFGRLQLYCGTASFHRKKVLDVMSTQHSTNLNPPSVPPYIPNTQLGITFSLPAHPTYQAPHTSHRLAAPPSRSETSNTVSLVGMHGAPNTDTAGLETGDLVGTRESGAASTISDRR